MNTSHQTEHLGLLFEKQGRNKDALAFYANNLKLDNKNAYAYDNLAGVYFALGEFDLAETYAKLELELKKISINLPIWSAYRHICGEIRNNAKNISALQPYTIQMRMI